MAYMPAAGPRTSKLKRLRPSSACRHGGLSVAEVVDAVAGVLDTPATAAAVATVLGFVFVGALGSAIVASVLVHLLGRWIGVPVAAVVVWLAVARPRTGLAYLFFDRLRLADIQRCGNKTGEHTDERNRRRVYCGFPLHVAAANDEHSHGFCPNRDLVP